MKRLLPILLLVFSVGVGDVYGGDRDSSPEAFQLYYNAKQIKRTCKPREFKRLAEQLLFSTDGTIIGKLGDEAISGLALGFSLLYDPITSQKKGANCALLADDFRESVWSSIWYHYESREKKRKLDSQMRDIYQKYGVTNFLESEAWDNRQDGINPNQRASAANDIIDRIERTRTIRAQQRAGSSGKQSGSTRLIVKAQQPNL